MGPDEQQAVRGRIFEIIRKQGELTDEEIAELRRIIGVAGYLGPVMLGTAEFRTSIELIVAIKKFDAASANLINTTNRLTKVILGLTALAGLFAGASLYVSCHSAPTDHRPPAGMDLNL